MTCAQTEPGRALFDSHWDLIERTIRFVVRRRRLEADTASDFTNFTCCRMLEDDAKILREFAGRSTLKTYLVTVVQRLYLDFRIQHYGKWRPSRRAHRLGPLAVELDRLLHREGRTLEQAARVLAERGRATSVEQLTTIARQIPNQRRRPRQEPLDRAEDIPCSGGVEDRIAERDRGRLGRRVARALATALTALPAEDRLLLGLRFVEGLTVRAIAASHGHEARSLYGRYDRILRGLRRTLEGAGVERREVGDLLAGGFAEALRFAAVL